MSRLVYRPAARADLAAIYRFIAADSTVYARRFVFRIRARVRMLTDYWHVESGREDIGLRLRILPMPNAVIVAYRVDGARIVALRIFYGGQDFETVLRG